MTETPPTIRIAIVAASEKRRRWLKAEIEKKVQLDVVACTALTEAFLHQLSSAHADVLLVDLYETEPTPDMFQQLLETKGVPVVFNDQAGEQGLSDTWVERLIDKLASLSVQENPDSLPTVLGEDLDADDEADAPPPVSGTQTGFSGLAIDFEEELGIPLLLDEADQADQAAPVEDTPSVAPTPLTKTAGQTALKQEPTPEPVEEKSTTKTTKAQTVSSPAEIETFYPDAHTHPKNAAGPDIWVLGASIGGPQAVKRFLSALPDKLEVSFLLVQHIGINFVDLLAEQLERSTAFRVSRAKEGDKLLPQQVLIAPADKYLSFHNNGDIYLKDRDKPTIYNPCIDDVLEEVAQHFPGAKAVIFSGMGDDGARGVKSIVGAGGKVWAQNEESCVISSMPDSARKQKAVSFSGSPEQLAGELVMTLKKNEDVVHQGVV